MKYLIVAESHLCAQLSEILAEEIRRFDIRHEILFNPSNVTSQLKKSRPDLLIVIGSSKSFSIVDQAKKRKIKCCFFHQTLMDKHDRRNLSQLSIRKIYTDIPVKSTDTSNVFLLSDVIRKLNGNNYDEVQSTEVSIFYSDPGKKRLADNLLKNISKLNPDINFNALDVSLSLKEAVAAANRSNASIALDQFSNVFAAYTNCPSVNVYQKSLFRKSNNENAVINKLLGKDIISNILANKTGVLISEIKKVLHDHQHCAGIMQIYQELKSLIGIQPFARQAAQEIIEWIDEDN
ncbi:hypothetical protein [Ekhidna sp.]|jgi:hypothetical protein|uniref:hypothetical protein n=1 Tax=Ekhidna sp. TaxID=2608089 RepID=UPI0032EA933B